MSLDMSRKVLAVGLVLGVMVLYIPCPAAAQERRAEVSGGWSYAHEGDVGIPAGWYASAGGYLNSWFGVVGEVSGHYKTIGQSGVDVKRNFHIFAAGPRFAYRRYPRFTPFVDLLAGGRRANTVTSAAGASTGTPVTDFAYQSNFGFAINNSSGSLGLRVSAGDYGVHSGGEWTNDSLFEAGVVLRR